MKLMELNQGHQELIKMVLDPEERKRFRRVLKRQYEKDDIEWIKNNELNLKMIINCQIHNAIQKAQIIETKNHIFKP